MGFSVIEGFREIPVVFVVRDILEYSMVDNTRGADDP